MSRWPTCLRRPSNHRKSLTQGCLVTLNLGRFTAARKKNLQPNQHAAIDWYFKNSESLYYDCRGVYLWGANDAGKSYIGAVLCMHMSLHHALESYFIEADELRVAMYLCSKGEADPPAYPDAEAGNTTLDTSRNVPFLVIDDLGKEQRAASGSFEKNLGSLLRHRIKEGLVTCFTSNLSLKEFRTIYGDSTTSLLVDACSVVRVEGSGFRAGMSAASDLKYGSPARTEEP